MIGQTFLSSAQAAPSLMLWRTASACYEDSIIDLSKMPMHNDKRPPLVMDMDTEAKKFETALRIVGVPETKNALSQLVETASLPFFGSVGEAKAA
ncbi:hypothetical protein BH11MYX1_BH11MYX1_00160 [soil metagenome]